MNLQVLGIPSVLIQQMYLEHLLDAEYFSGPVGGFRAVPTFTLTGHSVYLGRSYLFIYSVSVIQDQLYADPWAVC